MDAFNYRDGQLFAEGVALSAIAERFGTPTYVYSRAHIEAQYHAYADALAGMPHLVCFAVKANSNLGVLNVLARLGAGFDIVSRGELERVLAAGGAADKIVFSGVGKTRDDMRRALEVGVHCFNVESSDELERLQQVAAELNVRAPVSLRVNPDVDAGTHPYISTGLKENKFGIAIADAEDVYIRAAQLPNLEVVGVDCHIGSQLTTLAPSSMPSTVCWTWSTAWANAASTCATSTSVVAWACVIAMKSRRWPPTTSRPCANASTAATWNWSSNPAASSSPTPGYC